MDRNYNKDSAIIFLERAARRMYFIRDVYLFMAAREMVEYHHGEVKND